jgi:hypothetical protein
MGEGREREHKGLGWERGERECVDKALGSWDGKGCFCDNILYSLTMDHNEVAFFQRN